MKKYIIIVLALLCLMFSSCTSKQNVPQFSQPEETATTEMPSETPTTVPTEAPAETVPETTSPTEAATDPGEPELKPLAAGYYIVSSVGSGGGVSFFGTMDPNNGYLLLKEDGTGSMLFDGTEAELTWDEESALWNEREITGMILCYYDSELGQEECMLALYFMDDYTSVIFRPAEPPAD